MTVRSRRSVEIGLWVVVAAAMVFLMYESVKPSDRESLAAKSDKTAHALAYGGLAAVLVAALRYGSRWSAGRVALTAFAWATAYGAIAEVIQLFVGRVGDVLDALANAAGAGLVALAWLRLRARRDARRHEPPSP